MNNPMDMINWAPHIWLPVLVDLAIAVALLASIRKLSGVIGNVNSNDELTQRDNFAFGISFGGGLVALAIMLTGALSGEASDKNLLDEALLMLAYGCLGMVLMAVSRFILDKVSLPKISLHEEIMKGNVATSIIDASNMIATALIVRAVMVWIDDIRYFGLLAVAFGFIVSQLILVLVTKYRSMVYAKRHAGGNFQDALRDGNSALAIRYFGHKIGVALSVTAASGFVNFSKSDFIITTLIWGGFSIVMTVFLSLICIIARHVVLYKVNVVEEVDNQKNIGVGAIEGMIYIAVGLLLAALFA